MRLKTMLVASTGRATSGIHLQYVKVVGEQAEYSHGKTHSLSKI